MRLPRDRVFRQPANKGRRRDTASSEWSAFSVSSSRQLSILAAPATRPRAGHRARTQLEWSHRSGPWCAGPRCRPAVKSTSAPPAAAGSGRSQPRRQPSQGHVEKAVRRLEIALYAEPRSPGTPRAPTTTVQITRQKDGSRQHRLPSDTGRLGRAQAHRMIQIPLLPGCQSAFCRHLRDFHLSRKVQRVIALCKLLACWVSSAMA